VTDHGKVVRLAENHGFVETSGGEEIYFHRNSVIGSFDDLSVGNEVRLVISETEGEKGLQGKHGHPNREASHCNLILDGHRLIDYPSPGSHQWDIRTGMRALRSTCSVTPPKTRSCHRQWL
jgi:hypothetical protein